MTILRVSRLCLLACTAVGCGTVSGLAHAQVVEEDDDAYVFPRSPLFGATRFSQKLPRLEELGPLPLPVADSAARLPVPASCTGSPGSAALDTFLNAPLSPAPREAANTQGQNPWKAKVNACLGLGLTTSPIEGRPPGQYFAHQRFDQFYPTAYVQTATAGARVNSGLRDSQQRHGFSAGTEFGPGGLYFNAATGPTNNGIKPRLHPGFPNQNANSLWTFDGTFPGKVIMARYGQPMLFRHYNALPIHPGANNGFGVHQLTTHLHNGHNPGESDGFPGAYFYPGQYYDYRWPFVLSGHDRVNSDILDRRSSAPDGAGGLINIPGDYQETISTQWFHDHRVDHTSENVYKGMAGMLNIYSGIDRGKEGLGCHYSDPVNNINLCLPSGTHLDWGNRDYDVNLMVADKSWDANGQLIFNPFAIDGFLGDKMTVNWAWAPYLDVRPRRYRFRIVNTSVSRLFKIGLFTAAGKRVPFYMVANDGNIMEHAVPFPNAESQDLPLQSIGERFDIVVDFKGYAPGTKFYFVNFALHEDGSRAKKYEKFEDAWAGRSEDPGVGKFMEFRVAAPIAGAQDLSMNPADYVEGKLKMIPRAKFTPAELAGAKLRHFQFGHSGGTDAEPWTINTDGGKGLLFNTKRVSALPSLGAVEIWTLTLGDDGESQSSFAHPIHIHFEEGQILSRDGLPPPIWERWARKDMYNIGRLASNDLKVVLRFGDFLGSYVEHCHNLQHEDYAMMLRFDVNNPGQPMLIRAPLPHWSGVGYANSYLLSE